MDRLEDQYPIISPPLPLGRLILHAIAIIIGWLVYFWFASYSINANNIATYRFIGAFMLLTAIVIPLVTFFWIRHNLNIFKKKGPRNHVPLVEESYTKDWFGMSIQADREKIKSASKVTIVISNNTKMYITE